MENNYKTEAGGISLACAALLAMHAVRPLDESAARFAADALAGTATVLGMAVESSDTARYGATMILEYLFGENLDECAAAFENLYGYVKA